MSQCSHSKLKVHVTVNTAVGINTKEVVQLRLHSLVIGKPKCESKVWTLANHCCLHASLYRYASCLNFDLSQWTKKHIYQSISYRQKKFGLVHMSTFPGITLIKSKLLFPSQICRLSILFIPHRSITMSNSRIASFTLFRFLVSWDKPTFFVNSTFLVLQHTSATKLFNTSTCPVTGFKHSLQSPGVADEPTPNLGKEPGTVAVDLKLHQASGNPSSIVIFQRNTLE